MKPRPGGRWPRRWQVDGLVLRDVQRALYCLPVEQREVMLLVCVEEMSYQEASQVLNVPAGTVMSRLAGARTYARFAGRGEGASCAVESGEPFMTNQDRPADDNERVLQALSAYIDDALPGDERDATAARIANDAACEATVAAYRAQDNALRALFAAEQAEPQIVVMRRPRGNVICWLRACWSSVSRADFSCTCCCPRWASHVRVSRSARISPMRCMRPSSATRWKWRHRSRIIS